MRILRDGFDVGVVGYTTQDTPTTTLKLNVADLDFSTGGAARVAAAIRELRAAGSAPVVLLAHASDDPEWAVRFRRESQIASPSITSTGTRR